MFGAVSSGGGAYRVAPGPDGAGCQPMSACCGEVSRSAPAWPVMAAGSLTSLPGQLRSFKLDLQLLTRSGGLFSFIIVYFLGFR